MHMVRFSSVALVILLHGCNSVDGRETLGDKEERGLLQTHEYASRDRVISEMEILKDGDYGLIALPDAKSGERVWVLTNPQHPPFYKQIPSTAQYFISESDIQKARAALPMSTTVLEVLDSHRAELVR